MVETSVGTCGVIGVSDGDPLLEVLVPGMAAEPQSLLEEEGSAWDLALFNQNMGSTS